MQCRAAQVGRVAFNRGLFALAQDHLVHADDGIDRRADFMRHVREEQALRLVCVLGLCFRFLGMRPRLFGLGFRFFCVRFRDFRRLQRVFRFRLPLEQELRLADEEVDEHEHDEQHEQRVAVAQERRDVLDGLHERRAFDIADEIEIGTDFGERDEGFRLVRFFTVIRTVDDDGALVNLLHHPFEAAARHERIKACLAFFIRRVARLADGVEVAADEPEGRAFDLLRVEKLSDDGVGVGLAIEDGVDIAVPLFVDGGGNEVGGARVVDDEHRLSVLDADKAGEGFKGNIIVAVDMRAIKAQDADVALEALLPHHLHEEVQFLRRFFDGLAVIFQRAQTAVDDFVVHLRHHGDVFGQLILHVFVQHHVQLMLDAVADQAEAAEREDEQHDEAALLRAEEIFFQETAQTVIHRGSPPRRTNPSFGGASHRRCIRPRGSGHSLHYRGCRRKMARSHFEVRLPPVRPVRVPRP